MPHKPNPNVPRCCSRHMRKNGTTTAGNTQWFCPDCKSTTVEGSTGRGGYRHGKPGGTPDAERKRKSRAKQKQKKIDMNTNKDKYREFTKQIQNDPVLKSIQCQASDLAKFEIPSFIYSDGDFSIVHSPEYSKAIDELKILANERIQQIADSWGVDSNDCRKTQA